MTSVVKGLIFAAASLFAAGASAQAPVTLNIAHQDAAMPALVKAAGVLEGAPIKVNWVILTGPAANLTALYSGAIDLGHMGDTSIMIEQANARKEWTAANAPLKIVAGWRTNYSDKLPPLVTAVRTSAKINTPQELKGHTWAYNFGGYNHAQYLASLVKGGLTEKDIKPIKFVDGTTSAAAFTSGQADVYSGGIGPVLQAIDKGEAKVLLSDRDTGIPALNVWTARKEVLDDPAKDAALKIFFERVATLWPWYAANKDQATKVLRDTLKLTPERAQAEYVLRDHRFRPFDADLIKAEQVVANTLLQGGAIKKSVDVGIGFDGRYNAAQKAEVTKQAN